MLITIITLFPKFFSSVFSESILKRAQKEEKIKINIVDLRDFGIGRHKQVDDSPYGGGVGMVLKVDVLADAINSVREKDKKEAVILLDPKGKVFKQKLAESFAGFEHLILICGHYEGFDERVRALVDSEISIGDYILSGGEIAAVVITEAVTRLIPGVLKKDEATKYESFSKVGEKRMLEHPHYTRPADYQGKKVPETLLSGNFKNIEKYRTEEAEKETSKKRPDL